MKAVHRLSCSYRQWHEFGPFTTTAFLSLPVLMHCQPVRAGAIALAGALTFVQHARFHSIHSVAMCDYKFFCPVSAAEWCSFPPLGMMPCVEA